MCFFSSSVELMNKSFPYRKRPAPLTLHRSLSIVSSMIPHATELTLIMNARSKETVTAEAEETNRTEEGRTLTVHMVGEEGNGTSMVDRG